MRTTAVLSIVLLTAACAGPPGMLSVGLLPDRISTPAPIAAVAPQTPALVRPLPEASSRLPPPVVRKVAARGALPPQTPEARCTYDVRSLFAEGSNPPPEPPLACDH